MNDQNKQYTEDEIDLVDVLGVLIKRRKCLFGLFLILFIVSSTLMFLKESNFVKNENAKLVLNNTCVEKNKNSKLIPNNICPEAEFVFSIENDYLYFIYNVLNVDYSMKINNPKFKFEITYYEFLNNFLFPESFKNKEFIISNIEDKNYFLFENETLMNSFISKYNKINKEILKANLYKNKMTRIQSSNCIEKMLATDDLFKAGYNCKMFFYNYNFFKDKVSLSIKRNISPSFFSYNNILDNINNSKINISKIENILNKIKKINELKIEEGKISFNKSKFIKYIIIVFILSFIMSVFMIYIFEFYLTNKDRLKEFFK